MMKKYKKTIGIMIAVFVLLAGSAMVVYAESQQGSLKVHRGKACIDPYEDTYAWNPFEEMALIQERMNRMFNHSFSRRNDYAPGMGFESEDVMFSPDIDVRETTDSYIVDFDLPGMEKDKIDINLNDNVLTVRGERKSEQEQQEKDENGVGTYYRRERSYGTFQQSFALPENTNPEKITAAYENGVLSVTIAKKEKTKQQKGKKIAIR